MLTAAELRILRAHERGHADHGWLQANHSFSFADYHDPDRMGFGHLRVLNQDRVQAGGGFATHGHQDMEIVTWVQAGELIHEDSMGNRGSLRAGELQVMSAGRGVRHSELNGSQEEAVELLQMWILPAHLGTEPRWEQRLSPVEERGGRFAQLVGPAREATGGVLAIDQDARLFATWLEEGRSATFEIAPGRRTYLQVARGGVRLASEELSAGDGVAIDPSEEARRLELSGLDPATPADVVVWDLA